MCWAVQSSDKKYTLDELENIFPFKEKKAPDQKEPSKVYKSPEDNPVFRAIEALDIRDVAIRAFKYVGREASFDNKGRLILDGRLTGTFIGKKGGQYFASTSGEPFRGNAVTLTEDITGMTRKESYKWLIEQFNLDHSELK